MPSLLKSRRTRIKKRIEKLQAELDLLDDAMLEAVKAGRGHVANYSFNSGEGQQSVTYRRLGDVRRERDQIEAQIERLYRKLNGTGLQNINVRRKG